MYDHLLYSHYQTFYFVWIMENLHTDKLAGAERVNAMELCKLGY